jgi:hypothetical protein
MIDYSLCPDVMIKSGQDKRGRGYVERWLNSLNNMPDVQDASGGKIKAALTSNTPLFVTSYQYVTGGGAFTCMNVMVARQDYRLIIGYDEKVIRVETLDARSARAQTRTEAARWAQQNNAQPGGAPQDGDPANNYGNNPMADNPYGNNPMANDPYANAPQPVSPYGVAIPASPYGVVIPAR